LTPRTTPLDLRRHLDGLHRHELELDPLAALPLVEPEDEDVRAVVAAVLSGVPDGAPPRERQERLRRELDRAAGVPRGQKTKHLRLVPAPRYDERRPARSGHVALTRECNLACNFCSARGVEGRPGRQRAAQAIAAVRRVAREGAVELVLGGAEPTLEWYLDDLVALARSLRFERIVLETNAVALADRGRAEALARAGISTARVALNAFDATIADHVNGVAGALERTLAGARALLDAGVAVELAVALLPGNRGALARVVEEAEERLPASRARVERVVARHILAGPGLHAPLSVADAARELAEGARAASRAGLALVTAPGSAPPPCVFDDLASVAGMLHLSEGLVEAGEASRDHARIPLCEGCGARHVCPGPRREVAAEVAAIGRRVPSGAPGVPLARERERVLRELRSVLFKTGRDGAVEEQRVLRINFHCNQACDFCFVSRELPAPEEALLEAELVEVARRGASLAISGGEPTLNPRLVAYLARARELGIDPVQLQTNAIKMSDPAYTAELVAAGLRNAFVSLHGTTAATSDRVTAAPGTFVKTVEGIKNLRRAGVSVCLNFVLCAYNAAELAELPDFVAREILAVPGAPAELNFSFVAAGSENVPRDTGLVPRFSDVAWALEAALDRARALGLPFLGFDSQCGVPACFLPEDVRAAWFLEDLPAEEVDAFAGAFRKGEACSRCALTRRCYGLRAAYADTYGTGELRPLSG
jgi:MoaA/NifB/PqqE/SkfB family radical SAM enzyme